MQAAIAHLKHESHDSWPRLMQSWSTTHAFRRHMLSNHNPKQKESTSNQSEAQYMVHDYFEDWPILALPSGFLLVSVNFFKFQNDVLNLTVSFFQINQDFDELYPKREAGLITKWDATADFIVELVRRETAKSDSYTLMQLREYDKISKRIFSLNI